MDPKDARDLAAIAEIERHLARCRAENERRESRTEVASAAAYIAGVGEATAAANMAQRQKERLVIKLRGLVNDADCREWLFGFAADLAIVYGQSGRADAGRIAEHMRAWIQELTDLREVQTRNGQTHSPRGKWFNKRVCGLAKECQIDLPSQRKAKRLARQAAGGAP
jgi:hypothetical protein